jgi:hypothetical protein
MSRLRRVVPLLLNGFHRAIDAGTISAATRHLEHIPPFAVRQIGAVAVLDALTQGVGDLVEPVEIVELFGSEGGEPGNISVP